MTDEDRITMIEKELKEISGKIDKLTEITQQTALQEYRLTKVEESLTKLVSKGSDITWKVLTPILSSVIAAVMAFIISGGLK